MFAAGDLLESGRDGWLVPLINKPLTRDTFVAWKNASSSPSPHSYQHILFNYGTFVTKNELLLSSSFFVC